MNFETTPPFPLLLNQKPYISATFNLKTLHFCYFLLSFNPPFYILKPLVYKDFASYLERETKSRTFSSCITTHNLFRKSRKPLYSKVFGFFF